MNSVHSIVCGIPCSHFSFSSPPFCTGLRFLGTSPIEIADTNLPRVIDDCFELLKWLIPLLDKFSRSRRFTLAERLESDLLAVLEECVDAAYSKHKRAQLNTANRRLSTVWHLWRWAFELRVISQQRYLYGSQLLVNIGAQLGAWQKSQVAGCALLADKHQDSVGPVQPDGLRAHGGRLVAASLQALPGTAS